jgi:hypothetical protein
VINGRFCPLLSMHSNIHTGFISKRDWSEGTSGLCWGQLEGLKRNKDNSQDWLQLAEGDWISASDRLANCCSDDFLLNICMALTNSVVLVRKRTIPTERPPLVGEVSANFCG